MKLKHGTSEVIRISARDFLDANADDLWSHAAVIDNSIVVELECSDGVVETRGRRLLFCRYMWELHRRYPRTPILISHQLSMTWYNKSDIRAIYTAIYRSIWSEYIRDPDFDQEQLWKDIREVSNLVYNTFLVKTEEWVCSISPHEIVEFLSHPEVDSIIKGMEPNQASVNKATEMVANLIVDPPSDMPRNMMTLLGRTREVDPTQQGQTVVARGYPAEIDSRVFPEIISHGYFRGLRSLYDHSTDSRSAARASYYAKDPLAICEYFNRQLQLVSSSISKIAGGNCQSKHYMPWIVDRSELRNMDGIHYTTEEEIQKGTYKLSTVRPNSIGLVGKTIYLRTPYSCEHPHRGTICEVCAGEVFMSLPRNVNPGHISAIEIGEKISQLVLKTKHVDTVGKLDDIYIEPQYRDYISVGTDGNSIKLSGSLDKLTVQLALPASASSAINNIDIASDIEELEPHTLTSLKEIKLLITDPTDPDIYLEEIIPVSMGSRWGYITKEFIYYMKVNHWSLSQMGEYVVDLSRWNRSMPLFRLPMKHINMIDFKNEVEAMIFSSDKVNGLMRQPNPTAANKSLLALISTKVFINLSHVFMITYAMASRDPRSLDYQLVRGGEMPIYSRLHDIMQGRSLGPMMAYESQHKSLDSAIHYVRRDVPSSPYDLFLEG